MSISNWLQRDSFWVQKTVHVAKSMWRSRLRRAVAPDGTRRERWLLLPGRVAHLLYWKSPSVWVRELISTTARRGWIPRWIRQGYTWFSASYPLVDRSQVVLYTSQKGLLPYHRLRHELSDDADSPETPAVSLVATLKDEKANVVEWFEDLVAQTRHPDEVVIVDAGSQDGTLELLQQIAEESPLSLRVLTHPGVNIAAGRNLGIREARGPVVAVTDFGCRLRPDWLHELLRPFAVEPQTQVVAGWYEAQTRTGRPVRYGGWPLLEDIDPQGFLPSSRSVAFTREAWESAGGYPEWLTLTGEDTLFAIELKRLCSHWAFAPEAIVTWHAPQGWPAYWRKTYTWALGDGESGVHAHCYALSLLRFLFLSLCLLSMASLSTGALLAGSWRLAAAALVAVGLFLAAGRVGRFGLTASLRETGFEAARSLGFLRGAQRRNEVERKRLEQVHGVFFILSGVPIDDTGGGARATQLALELLERRYFVFFIHKFPKMESVELNLRIRHPNLRTCSLADFSWQETVGQWSFVLDSKPLAAVLEFPLADFLPLVGHLRAKDATVIYDLLDDWQTSLGSTWYSPEVEQEVMDQSQVLVATAPVLRDRLEMRSGREVVLVPNAVNLRLFDPDLSRPRPRDLPEGQWRAIYIGALWGDWFDWQLLVSIARRYEDAAVVVIGDYRDQCRDRPPNLHFLGLKPQSVLPGYLSHCDVALIPWKTNQVTQATSPLKVYEYLAMGRPVVAPALGPLQDIPGVFLARDREHFVELIAEVRESTLPRDEMAAFVEHNSWQQRIDQILSSVSSHRAQSCETSTATLSTPRDATRSDV